MKNCFIFLLSCIFTFSVLPQTLIILNRTGFNLVDVRAKQNDHLSENLIPYDVILDQGFLELPMDVEEGMQFYFVDEMGDQYGKTLNTLLENPKLVVTINDLVALEQADNTIHVRIQNQVKAPITSLFLSSADKEEWGRDLLEGSILYQGDTLELNLKARGDRFFDIRFTCYKDDTYQDFYLKSVELRDMGLFSLRLQ